MIDFMNNKYLFYFLSILLINGAIACKQGEDNEKQKKQINEKELKEDLMIANKRALEEEEKQIKNYIDRYGWDVQKTGRGLRYMIYKEGKGQSPDELDRVCFAYEVRLINGELVYTSEKLGLKNITIGKSQVESGLEEGLKFLSEGAKAKLLIPSHLAHGLIGDQKKIKGKATLIYDVEILDVNKQ